MPTPSYFQESLGTPMVPGEHKFGTVLGYFMYAGVQISEVRFDSGTTTVFVTVSSRLRKSRDHILNPTQQKVLPKWVTGNTRMTPAEWGIANQQSLPGLVFVPEAYCDNDKPVARPNKPVIDEVKLVGQVDRDLSELKYILDHPDEFDSATFQTIKHHVEDMELFVKYALGKLAAIKALPPVAEQRVRGY